MGISPPNNNKEPEDDLEFYWAQVRAMGASIRFRVVEFCTTRRTPLRVAKWVAIISISLSAPVWTLYVYWNSARLFNFLAAWIPFVLTMLLAFVPEHKMTMVKKVLWRTGVIGLGLVWSIVLWHQQVITDEAARSGQERIVTKAVTESNKHSDQQIGAVRTDVQGIKTDMQGVKKDLETQINETVSKSTLSLSESIGKVSKPIPPELAKLQFAFYSNELAAFPILAKSITPSNDGMFTVDFMARNISHAPVRNGELWVQICKSCAYAKEPSGFQKPNGVDEHVRMKAFGELNPQVFIEKMTVDVSLGAEARQSMRGFVLSFDWACETCSPHDPWSQSILVEIAR